MSFPKYDKIYFENLSKNSSSNFGETGENITSMNDYS